MCYFLRAWALRLAVLSTFATSLSAAASPPVTLLITHPRASVLRHYVTLVRQHVMNVPNLQVVGIYHEAETEDYQNARNYLTKEHITWISLHPVHCPLTDDDVFRNNGCRDEFEQLFEHSQGIVFNGGADIPPALYLEPTRLLSRVDTPKRSNFEISLLVNLLGSPRAPGITPLLKQRPNYPVLGICMGMQSLNVADGGSLVQDIPSEIYGISTMEEGLKTDPSTWHESFIATDPALYGMAPAVFHPIRVSVNAPKALYAPRDSYPQVLSIHHQAVKRLGVDYVVYATSVDGKIVEAIGNKKFSNVLGVQFHPERATLWDAEALESTNPYAVSTNGPNMAYSTLEHDPASRSFMAGIWAWLSSAVQHVSSAAHT